MHGESGCSSDPRRRPARRDNAAGPDSAGPASAGPVDARGLSVPRWRHADAGAPPPPDDPAAARGRAALPGELLGALGKSSILVGAQMEDLTAAAARFDVRYLYLAGGLYDGAAPCNRCTSSCTSGGTSCSGACGWWGCWQDTSKAPGLYAKGHIAASKANQQVPMFTYYEMLAASGWVEGGPEVDAANDAARLTRLFNDYRFLLQQLGNEPALLHRDDPEVRAQREGRAARLLVGHRHRRHLQQERQPRRRGRSEEARRLPHQVRRRRGRLRGGGRERPGRRLLPGGARPRGLVGRYQPGAAPLPPGVRVDEGARRGARAAGDLLAGPRWGTRRRATPRTTTRTTGSMPSSPAPTSWRPPTWPACSSAPARASRPRPRATAATWSAG